jgi:amino acid permease
MDEEIKFKRTIFEKFPWLNLVMTIAIMILQIVVAILDYFTGHYFWTVWLILSALLYLFLMVPTSYRLMKKTMQNNKNMRDLEKRINEQRERWKL